MDKRRIREIINEEILMEAQSKTMIKTLRNSAAELSFMIQKYDNSKKLMDNEEEYGLDVTFMDDLRSALGKLMDYSGYVDNVRIRW